MLLSQQATICTQEGEHDGDASLTTLCAQIRANAMFAVPHTTTTLQTLTHQPFTTTSARCFIEVASQPQSSVPLIYYPNF